MLTASGVQGFTTFRRPFEFWSESLEIPRTIKLIAGRSIPEPENPIYNPILLINASILVTKAPNDVHSFQAKKGFARLLPD